MRESTRSARTFGASRERERPLHARSQGKEALGIFFIKGFSFAGMKTNTCKTTELSDRRFGSALLVHSVGSPQPSH